MKDSLSPEAASHPRGPDDSSPADLLEQLWQRGETPEPAVFLAQFDAVTTPQVVEVLLVDQRARLWRGDRPRAEAYLANHPSVRADAEAMLDLVYGEYLLAEELGDKPDVEEYARRFPAVADALRVQVELHQALPDADEVTPPGGALPFGDGVAPALPGYEILGKLGRGGMGVVYKARQSTLKRLVALKVILAGAQADAEHQRRFQREAEAVASLRHPNVVQVYDYGTAGGCPYLVLEYVEGGTLAQKTAGNPQPPAEAARLVETLAAAMEHAHQHGLIHRDLKPANVLLTADGVLKIADFGLAKQLDTGDLQTTTGALVGTPSHMAPEQVEEAFGPVGPATDVYALGVILYELLTGRLPFQGGMLAVLQQIKERVPARPSRLRPGIPRDLETICLKCLEKAPARRYASAAALAEDLRRFQLDEPITARPVRMPGRSWRWCRRNPALAGLAALLAVALLGGLTGVTAMWLQAERLRQTAEDNLDESRTNLRLAIDAVDQFCTRVSEDPRLKEHDLRALRRQLLQTAVEFHQQFVARRREDIGLRADLARAYFRLGQLTAEIDARSHALTFYTEAQGLFEQLVRDHPDEPEYGQRLAQCHDNLGLIHEALGEPARAEAAFRKSLELIERLTHDHPDRPAYRLQRADLHARLGFLYRKNGRAREAEAPLKEALALSQALMREYPDVDAYQYAVARYSWQLGMLCHHQFIRRWREAEPAYQTALKVLQDLARRNPAVSEYRGTAVSVQRDLAKIHLLAKRNADAEQAIKDAIATQEELVREHGSVTSYQVTLALLNNDLGTLYQAANRLADAEAPCISARKTWERIVLLAPDELDHVTSLGKSQQNVGFLHGKKGETEAALEWSTRSIQTLTEVLERNPKQSNARDFLPYTYGHRAELLNERGRHAEALADWDRSVEADHGPLRPWRCLQRALTRARLGDHAAATAEARQVAAEAGSSPAARRLFADAARVHGLAARVVQRDGALSEAEQALLVEAYASRATELLQQAMKAGYRSDEQLQKDADFAALRGRPEFEKLFAERGTRPQK